MKWIVFLFSLLVFVSCATPSFPTGGERDTTPPKLLNSIPSDSSLNFKGKELKFKFNEFIQLTNPSQSVIITPTPIEFPNIYVRKNELFIKFKNPLLDSTTYTIAFNNALRDLNEGNPLPNYDFVFSTGPTLDSLEVLGKLNFLSDIPFPPNTFVGLYAGNSDSLIYKERPLYIKNLSSPGDFVFSNLKAGNYQCFALSDKNYNFLFDLPNELVGFSNEQVILPNDSMKPLIVNLFNSINKNIKIQNFSPTIKNDFGFLELNQSIGLDKNWSISFSDTSLSLKSLIINSNRNKISFWLNNPNKITNCTIKLAINSLVEDSISLVLNSLVDNTNKLVLVPKNIVKQNTIQCFPTHEISFTSDFLIDSSMRRQGAYLLDTISLSQKNIPYVVDNLIVTFFNIYLDSNYSKLVLPAKTFISYNGIGNDSISFNLKSVKADELGTLKILFHFPNDSSSYIIKIYNKETNYEDVFRSINNDSIYWYKDNLIPGIFKVEVIFDDDNNGIFTGGSFEERRLPEFIFIYEKPFVLKNNWDLEEEVNVSRDFSSNSKSIQTNNKIEIDKKPNSENSGSKFIKE